MLDQTSTTNYEFTYQARRPLVGSSLETLCERLTFDESDEQPSQSPVQASKGATVLPPSLPATL